MNTRRKAALSLAFGRFPDGAERYAFRVKQSTTTDLTPEEIHEIGLAQVKEIEGRMLGVAHQLGYPDLKSFYASIKDEPQIAPSLARRNPRSLSQVY